MIKDIEKAKEYIKQGEFGKANLLLSKLIAKSPNIADLYAHKAYCYLKVEWYEMAVMNYARAVSLKPNVDIYRKGLIYCTKQMKKIGE